MNSNRTHPRNTERSRPHTSLTMMLHCAPAETVIETPGRPKKLCSFQAQDESKALAKHVAEIEAALGAASKSAQEAVAKARGAAEKEGSVLLARAVAASEKASHLNGQEVAE
jgi:hypothetical protein